MEPVLHLESRRVLARAAALTIAAAVAAVAVVRLLAVRVLHPPPAFTPLDPASPLVATIVCTAIAVYVFIGMASYPNPVRTWRRVAAVVLLLSFVPCVPMAISHWPEACALMAMHAVVWAVCVTILPALALTRQPGKGEAAGPLSIL